MSHAKNKLEWCLRKAEKELKESDKHRGLVKINPDIGQAMEYLKKAQRYVKNHRSQTRWHIAYRKLSAWFLSMLENRHIKH